MASSMLSQYRITPWANSLISFTIYSPWTGCKYSLWVFFCWGKSTVNSIAQRLCVCSTHTITGAAHVFAQMVGRGLTHEHNLNIIHRRRKMICLKGKMHLYSSYPDLFIKIGLRGRRASSFDNLSPVICVLRS